jgi:hypothetical protein
VDGSIVLGDVDIMGRMHDVDILGDDAAAVMESLGALSPQQASHLSRQMAQARNINPDAVLVRQQLLRRMGIQACGSTPLVFTALTAVQTVQLQVTRPFLPLDLIVGSSIAPFFRINNIQINGVNQLPSTGALACESISEASLRPKFKLDTVNTSLPLTAEVQMTDLSATRTFILNFFGVALLK